MLPEAGLRTGLRTVEGVRLGLGDEVLSPGLSEKSIKGKFSPAPEAAISALLLGMLRRVSGKEKGRVLRNGKRRD